MFWSSLPSHLTHVQVPTQLPECCRLLLRRVAVRSLAQSRVPLACQGYSTYIFSPPSVPLFSSLALFAFWLRSSVVSVLFSLIAKTLLRKHFDYSYFWKPLMGHWACSYSSAQCRLYRTIWDWRDLFHRHFWQYPVARGRSFGGNAL